MNPTTATIPTVEVLVDDERIELVGLFSDCVEGVLAWSGSQEESTEVTGTIPGTDLAFTIVAGFERGDGSWMGLTVTNADGATVWERSTDLDWDDCDQVPEAFVAWFHEA